MIASAALESDAALLLRANWQAVAITLLLLVPFLNYAVVALSSELTVRSSADGKAPPTIPYWIPGLGHFMSVATDALGFSKRIA